MMADESEIEDIMEDTKPLEAAEKLKNRLKALSIEFDGGSEAKSRSSSRGRRPHSYSSIENLRNESSDEEGSRSPKAGSRLTHRQVRGAAHEAKLKPPSSSRRPRSFSTAEKPRSESPGIEYSQSPKARRSIKKSQIREGSDHTIGSVGGNSHGRHRSSISNGGSNHIRTSSTSRRGGGSSHGSDHIRERLLGNVGGIDSIPIGSNHSSDGTFPGNSGNNHLLRRGSISSSGSNHIRASSTSRRGGGSSHGSSHIRERLLGNGGVIENIPIVSNHGTDETYPGNTGNNHLLRRGSISSSGSNHIRTSSTSRRGGGSSHGSSHIRERLLGNGGVIESLPFGSNHSTDETFPGSTGSNHHRLARRNVFQSPQDQGHGNRDEKEPLSDSNHSIVTSPLSTGQRISWKSDPRASFCDWRIEVVHLSKDEDATNVVDVYNIHRNIVGFGSRRSNLMCKQFIRQIDDNDYAAGSNITRFTLPSLQAGVFPMVLDFMYYTNEVKQKLTAEKACCVFLIAEMMDIPPLQEALDAFYQKSLSWKNITEFLMAATSLKADRLLWTSNVKLGSLVMENPELAGLVRPKFLLDLLKINKEQVLELQAKSPELYPDKLKRSQSRIWSRAAYACAMHNTKLMNKDLFDTMTDEACLPEIDPKVALQFLIMDSGYNPETTEYRSLQTRCVNAITENWEEFSFGFSSKDELKREILKLPSRLLNDILLSESTTVEF